MSVDLTTIPRGVPATSWGGNWWIYLHIATDDGSVLYVGCSATPRERMAQHKNNSQWWPQVAHVEIRGPWDIRAEALDEEKRLIRRHQPPHNTLGTLRDPSIRTNRGDRRRDSSDFIRGRIAQVEAELEKLRARLDAAVARETAIAEVLGSSREAVAS